MDDKIRELLAELPAEIQEELKEVQTQDEIMAVLDKHAVPLPDEALEAVAGGEPTGTNSSTSTKPTV